MQAITPATGIVRRVICATGLLAAIFTIPLHSEEAEKFFRQRGQDPAFAEVMASGDLPRGTNSGHGVKGSKISLEHELLKTGPNAKRRIPQEIKIHTLGNSSIPRGSFSNWSRWYQEDGNTQIFRLFKDEENVRNSRKQAARVEAFSDLKWKRGDWHEWVGTYTIIKPHGAAIFQAKNNENDWSVQLNMNDDGDIRLNHRRGTDEVIARNMVGTPFHIRVRDNGHDYEVYLNGKLKGQGSYARPKGVTNFRWGMYLGANDVKHDAMILVTGAGIDPKNHEETPEPARTTEVTPPDPEPKPPAPGEGLHIPERLWTNKDGGTMRAAAVYQAGGDIVKLKIDDRWIPYSLKDLSEKDRTALRQAQDFMEK